MARKASQKLSKSAANDPEELAKLIRRQIRESRQLRRSIGELSRSLEATGIQRNETISQAERHRRVFARLSGLGHRSPRTILKLPRTKLYAIARRFDDPAMSTADIARWFAKSNPDHPSMDRCIYRLRKVYSAASDSIERGESTHDMLKSLPRIT